MNRTRTGIALLILSHGLVGCGEHGSPPSAPTAPSVQQPSPPSPQPNPIQPIQPTAAAVAPHEGSTRGGAWATITGADFQRGASVRLGDGAVTAYVLDSATILFFTTAHPAGTVDVVVTNPGGLFTRLTEAYTFAPPESFDFNGEWVAHAGAEYETDMRFTIRNDTLVSVSCGGSAALTFSPPPAVHDGDFSFVGDDGLAISGTLVSPVNAVGTINLPEVPACRTAGWWADKSGEAAGSSFAYTRR
jgi:IPT/TIG domain-containing protein